MQDAGTEMASLIREEYIKVGTEVPLHNQCCIIHRKG